MKLFERSVERVLEFLSISGALPLQWNKGEPTLRLRYTLIALGLNLLSAVRIFDYELILQKSPIRSALQLSAHVFKTLTTISHMLTFIVNINQLQNALRSLVKIQNALGSEPVRVNLTFKLGFPSLIILTSLSSLWMFQNPKNLLFFFVIWNMQVIHRLSLFMLFCFLIQVPGRCLDTMNHVLRKSPSPPIPELIAIYDRIVDESKTLNRCFNIQISMNLALNVYKIIHNLYVLVYDDVNHVIQASAISYILALLLHTVYLFVHTESIMSKVIASD